MVGGVVKTPRPLLKTDTNGRAGEWFWLVFAIFSEHKRSRGGVGLWYSISISKVKATIENLSENPNELWLIVSRESKRYVTLAMNGLS